MQLLPYSLLLFVISFSQASVASSKIFWQTYHRPPSVIKYGEHQGKGFVQLVLNQIVLEMPEYEHIMATTSLARAIEDIKLGKQVCHPSLIKTASRQASAYFSKAVLISPTNRIVMTQQDAQQLGLRGPVDLTSLLREPFVTAGVIKSRSFGTRIDNILLAHADPDHVVEISNNSIAPLFKMLLLDRLSFTIAYPFELRYFNQGLLNNENALASFAIKNAEAYVLGNIACSKTPWGKQVIRKVDEVLKQIKSKQSYLNAMTTWWEPERNSDAFKQFYNTTFMQQ